MQAEGISTSINQQ